MWPFNSKKEQNLETVQDKSTVAIPPVPARQTPTPTVRGNLPNGRASSPSGDNFNFGNILNYYGNTKTLTPAWFLPIIPIIRRLTQTNEDMGQALFDLVSLANTGHEVYFDSTVSEEQAVLMREHLKTRQQDWATGQAGMDGVVNRMLAQIMISGALSNEWVPDDKLRGVESIIMVAPETILWALNDRRTKYEPYQRVTSGITAQPSDLYKLTQLNPETFKYFALNGDGEVPYGCPPYLPALRGIRSQSIMRDNIDFICEQLGITGFIEFLVEKPEMKETGETEDQYFERLDAYLEQVKQRIKSGFKDGAIVGFKDEHDIKFNSIARDFKGVTEMVNNNELFVASALKTDPSLIGRAGSSSETQISIIFTKTLSQLFNIINLVKENLEFGYALEFRLAGFVFKSLEVKFNKSTLQDELKYQQGQEILRRNLLQDYLMGSIDELEYALRLGYGKNAQPTPRVSPEILAGGSNSADQAQGDQKRQKGKDASDRKVRDKNKPQGTKPK